MSAFDREFQVEKQVELVSHEEVEQVLEKQEEHYEQVSEAEKEEVEGKDEEDEEGGTGRGVMMVTQDDDELAESTMVTNEELTNTDELNRKFEEFIRKMKEEIRIEAQRHPIAV